MLDSEAISYQPSNIPTLIDVKNKLHEQNSIDLLDERKNQIFYDEISSMINNLSEAYKENKEIKNINEIVEEIFLIVFLFCQNKQFQIVELIPQLFILKSVSKSALLQFYSFLNKLQKNNIDLTFDEEINGFLNYTKEVLLEFIKDISNESVKSGPFDQKKIEFGDLTNNFKFILTFHDSLQILLTIYFLTEKFTDKAEILQVVNFIIDPFVFEQNVPSFAVDFISKLVENGIIEEIHYQLTPTLLKSLSNKVLVKIIENPVVAKNERIFSILYKICKENKNQMLCNSIAMAYVHTLKSEGKKHSSFARILSYCNIEQFSMDFWNDLGDLDCVDLPESIIEQIVEQYHRSESQTVPLPVIISKLVFNPHTVISHEEAVDILTELKDLVSVNCILTLNFNDDILMDPLFWHRYASSYKEVRLSANGVVCFWNRFRQNQISIGDVLFYNNLEPNENKCNFFQLLINRIGINLEEADSKLIALFYPSIKSSLFPSFWSMFNSKFLSNLYEEAPDEYKAFYYYGLSCTNDIRTLPFNQIKFNKLSEESHIYLNSILKDNSIILTSKLPPNIQTDLLSFISSTILCTNLYSNDQIENITFENIPDCFLFFALLINVYQSSNSGWYTFLEGDFLSEVLKNVKTVINNSETIHNINSFIEFYLNNFIHSKDVILRFDVALGELVNLIWENFKSSEILSIFPKFNVFLYSVFNINRDPIISTDSDMAHMLFDTYKNEKNLDSLFPRFNKYIDISELLNEPTPELFSFITDYLHIDAMSFYKMEKNEDLIIHSFLDHFKIDPKRNSIIDQVISSLNNDQIIRIINENLEFIDFQHLIDLIVQNKPKEDQLKILSIKPYVEFIRKQVYKSLSYVLNQNQHELFATINSFFTSNSIIKLIIDPKNENFLNLKDFNAISLEHLFELDNILNSSFNSENERIEEAILFLFKFIIKKICNNEEIPDDIKFILFLPKTSDDSENINFALEPTFESFYNLRNVVKIIFEEILTFERISEFESFLTKDQYELLNAAYPLFDEDVLNSLISQARVIVQSTKSFREDSFPISTFLKIILLNKVNDDFSLYNNVHIKLCKNSTGLLYFINLMQSYSSTLNIPYDHLVESLKEHTLGSPESLKCLKEALLKLFIASKDLVFFYLDINYSLFKKPSRQSVQMIRNNFLKGPFNYSYFALLTSLVMSYPHLFVSVFEIDDFNSHDVIWFIKKILKAIQDLPGQFNESINLIVVLIKIPQLGDQIIQFFFENLLSFDIISICAFLRCLEIECTFSSIQTVIISYLIRYDFPKLSKKIISKVKNDLDDLMIYYSNLDKHSSQEETENSKITIDEKMDSEDAKIEKETEDFNGNKQNYLTCIAKQIRKINDKIKPIKNIKENSNSFRMYFSQKRIINSILSLLTFLIRFEGNEILDCFNVALMISKMQNPFYELNEHISSYSTLSQSNHSTTRLTFNYKVFNSNQFLCIDETREEIENMVKEIETVDYNYSSPLDISPEYFQELPNFLANKLIIERFPRLNKRLTSPVYEILLKYPPWVLNWIIKRPSTPLLQLHYDIIINCINEINSLSLETPSKPSLTSFSKQSAFLQKQTNVLNDESSINLNYRDICECFYLIKFNDFDYFLKLLHTIILYIYSHKSSPQNFTYENKNLDSLQLPREFLIFFAILTFREIESTSNFISLLYTFKPISNLIIDDIIDIVSTPLFANNSGLLKAILQFCSFRVFYRHEEDFLLDPRSKYNKNNFNQRNRSSYDSVSNFSDDGLFMESTDETMETTDETNEISDGNYGSTEGANESTDEINESAEETNETDRSDNQNNEGMNENNEGNTENIEGNDENEEVPEEIDFDKIDEIYRYDFLVLLTMSESPEVLSLLFTYAPKQLIKASLKRDSCISNAFIRSINSENINKYSDFYKHLQKYKEFFPMHEDLIIIKIRSLMPEADTNASQLVSLFSMFSYKKIDDPTQVNEENYDSLSPFWQLVYDSRGFISKILLDQNTLIDTSFKFMQPIVHMLSFDFRIKYLKMFVRELIRPRNRSIVVRRDHILEDSFENIMRISPEEFLSHLSIIYDGERGVDAGGLLRDWFTNLTNALFNENYALFISSKVHGTFLPNPNSSVNNNHLMYFEFTGRIFARAIVEQINLEPHLALALRKKLLKNKMSIEDIEEFDPDLYSSLKWILENDLNPSLEMYFTADSDNIGQHETHELIENGSKILVTNENKDLFVQKTVEYRTEVAINDQLSAFCTGFFSIIPDDKIGIFNPEELDKIICGEPFIDVDDWQRNCCFSGAFSINHPTIVNFFNVIRKWDQNSIAKLLYFITGSPRVPLGGFSTYKEFGRPITIGSVNEKDKLITAHTCSNMLDLPIYDTEEELNDKIRLAIRECNSFDFH